MKNESKIEVRVRLNKEEVKQLDNLKELFTTLSRAGTIRMMIKKMVKGVYKEEE